MRANTPRCPFRYETLRPIRTLHDAPRRCGAVSPGAVGVPGTALSMVRSSTRFEGVLGRGVVPSARAIDLFNNRGRPFRADEAEAAESKGGLPRSVDRGPTAEKGSTRLQTRDSGISRN